MSIGYLLLMISLLPLIVGVALLRLYGSTKLTVCVFIYMLFLGMWQIDISVLYFKGVLAEETILMLFKFFRVPTIVTPLLFYMILILVDKNRLEVIEKSWKEKLFLLIVNKWTLVVLTVWSLFVYIVHLTPYGITGLRIEKTEHLSFYYPVYGPLSFLYSLHIVSYIIVICLLIYSLRYMTDMYLKRFMRTFSVVSILLFIPALLNFLPNTGLMLGSMGVILYTVVILVSFIQMYNDMMKNYHSLLERQQKLDSIGVLTSNLVHEVKNSLTLIKGYTDLLLRSGDLTKKQEELISFVKLGGDQLDGFVDSYSTFMKSSQMTFKLADLKQLIENIIDTMYKHSSDLKVNFHCNQKKVIGYINSPSIHQVIVNLLKNSIEAMEAKKVKEVHIYLFIEKDQIIIDVIDCGKGIEVGQLEKVFHPFYSSKESSGLGLAFCRKIVFEHRGDIKIVKTSNEGTQIRIILPQLEYSRAINL